ncbi:lipoyl synthase [Coxiella endosymbiont of Amblyomma americanum]|uniref:lipoyl synthase n=1 Tax=Coxiella endosymbiont of Amblyomma americanum TaxID=325775 RepID=UPI00057E2BCF|nr:lipoyl synthase [Coxiella endosymbiont of Amblyomma americanum]AJC50516.1 lipoyl synthase [Coxiella endosymbiont of Amblyomma americanum]AUJ58850.1 lipoyl synthase [Coxiella-like endosymbiont of Amblyomma americanum]
MLKYNPTQKSLGKEKLSRIPIKIEPTGIPLQKPFWIRTRLPIDNKVEKLKVLLRDNKLVTVCEEAACPNLSECFSHGTAAFMIMGDKCTRRCSFCNVGHGRPDPLNPEEPSNLANTIHLMHLKYVVITSVDRDDLRDGGALHYVQCINAVRMKNPGIKIEILVPDFRGRMEKALYILSEGLPDIFNHNIETIPRLYKQARPGSDYQWSLALLQKFKKIFPGIPTKSGIMLGLGETRIEIKSVMQDLRKHGVDMITLGQYLQPSRYHMQVDRYITPKEFYELGKLAKNLGFISISSGPLVRSSYHADLQAQQHAT